MGGLCLFLSVACGLDYWKQKIPNWLVGCIALWGMLFADKQKTCLGVLYYWGVGLSILVVGYLLFSFGGLGAGDVKLLAAVAGFLPFEKICSFIFYSMLIAVILSFLKIKKKQNAWGTVKICLSGPIFLGVLLYMGGVY